MQSPRIAHQWERSVVLRLGRFVGLRGPGLFWVMPFVDRVSAWVDQRTVTTSFAAEQTLTSDTVPVNVDAVLFWMVHDVEKAALEPVALSCGCNAILCAKLPDGFRRGHRAVHNQRERALRRQRVVNRRKRSDGIRHDGDVVPQIDCAPSRGLDARVGNHCCPTDFQMKAA